MKPFQTINTQDYMLQKIQDNVGTAVDPIAKQSILGGNLLQGVSLKSGIDNLITHGLGRAYVAWFLGGQDAQSDVWAKVSPMADKFLNLRSSADVTVNLWVV